MMDFINDILGYKILSIDGFTLSVYKILAVVAIFVVARFSLIIIKAAIFRFLDSEGDIHNSNKKSLYRIVKYFVYTITILTVLKSTGLDISFILASSTALFVGLGFGLQDAFKDMASGILMMIERNVKMGDIIEVNTGMDSTVGQVEEINIRTSKIRTRDGIMIIVPNSKFINDSVINWSNEKILTRFNVSVGVAYGSDTVLVKKILLDIANNNELIAKDPEPAVMFSDFGDSSLDFKLFFWTDNLWKIERLRSDIRFLIDLKFRENNITIPFPQRDLHVMTDLRIASPTPPRGGA